MSGFDIGRCTVEIASVEPLSGLGLKFDPILGSIPPEIVLKLGEREKLRVLTGLENDFVPARVFWPADDLAGEKDLPETDFPPEKDRPVDGKDLPLPACTVEARVVSVKKNKILAAFFIALTPKG